MLSCIIPTFNEGSLLGIAAQSILQQSYEDFELIIVADGATSETLECIEGISDPRVRVIFQHNMGLSAARNRGIAEATRDYIVFLDADDSRPNWSFQEICRRLETKCDLLLCPGALQEVRGEYKPFYDQKLFEMILASEESKRRQLALQLQPQSANKVVSRDFLSRTKLRFPEGRYFEDIFFHVGAVLMAGRIEILDSPTFCYFRRYKRPQITSNHGSLRFDSIFVVSLALSQFVDEAFKTENLAKTVLAACKNFLKWNEAECSYLLRDEFRIEVNRMQDKLDIRWQNIWGTV